jgi:hypothetical protein
MIRPRLEGLVKLLREKNLSVLDNLLELNTQYELECQHSHLRVDHLVEKTSELEFRKKQLDADIKKLDNLRSKQREQLEEELARYLEHVRESEVFRSLNSTLP